MQMNKKTAANQNQPMTCRRRVPLNRAQSRNFSAPKRWLTNGIIMVYVVNQMTNRIKQLRLAKGMSLDDLAASMGAIVTKQAISKYENNLAKPTHKVAARLANALGVPPLELWREPSVTIKFVAYRKRASLTKTHQA